MQVNRLRLAGLWLSILWLVFSSNISSAQANPEPTVRRAESVAITPPLRELVSDFLTTGRSGELPGSPSRDWATSADHGLAASGPNFSLGLNFLALGNGFPNYSPSSAAPDPSLAVGTTQIVQWTQTAFAVFDKSSGALESGPISGNTIWASLGGGCANSNASQPIVQWDMAHQRWVLTESLMSGPPYSVCIAVSTSSDALGSYYLYQYGADARRPDSPKWGVWSNGYYQSQAEYDNSGFLGPQLCAYNSAKLVAGDGSAEQICFTLSPADGLPLPADIDSQLAPPAHQDEFFMSLWDAAHLSLYSLHPDYENPQNSTVTGNNGSQLIPVPGFTPACNGSYGGDCVPQKNGLAELQVVGDRLMYRLAYWEDMPVGNARASAPLPLPSQHWDVVHDSTAAGGNEAPRWYEFTAPIRAVAVTGILLFQSGTFAPDSNDRWMGSIARDKNHDVLMGYSESSSSMYPAIAVTGRTISDPVGTLENELIVIDGAGPSPASTWGNFSSMRIDPDGCTFWYTNEYYLASALAWSTQIGSVKFSGCH